MNKRTALCSLSGGDTSQGLGDTAPVQGTCSWGTWKQRHSQRKSSRKETPSHLARELFWALHGDEAGVPSAAPQGGTPQTELRAELAREPGLRGRKCGRVCTADVAGPLSPAPSATACPVYSFWPRPQCTRPGAATARARGSPTMLQAAAGLMPGLCYLCTMSLISFTELRSLLKS